MANARGVSPYLPLHLSPEIERDIERVMILADTPVMSRPIAAARVWDALPKACARDHSLCLRVQHFLERFTHKAGVTTARIEVADAQGAYFNAPNQHGEDTRSAVVGNIASYWQPGDHFLINAGVSGDKNAITPTNTFISLGFATAQLDIGYRDHWFSPFTDSSMLISTQAATLPSITLSNYKPLGLLGFSYELFLGELSRSANIAYQDRNTIGNPRLAGLRLAIEPAAGWSLAANRILQYGGGERPSGSFLNALIKPRDYDNTSDTLNSDQQFGNQVAAWTSRTIFPGRKPFSVYFEYAGEDTSYSGNYRLGNSALSVGIDIPKLWRSLDLTYEASEWQNAWYVHSVYQDGLRNHGHVIGHWFGDDRVLGDGVGGQSHMLRLGWTAANGSVAEFRYRTIQNASYSNGNYDRAHDVTLRYSYPWRNLLVASELNLGRDVFGDDYSRIGASASFGGDVYQYTGGDIMDDDTNDDGGTELFVDAGSSANRLHVRLGDGTDPYTTATRFAPHIGIGARRQVSDHGDLGARVELDNIDGHMLLAFRALDYRHRLSKHIAWTAFAGAARYNLATPAYGYYGGVGAQWRNLFRNCDLNFDVRYGDKIARDKFPAIPSDAALATPEKGYRPDMFYDLMGVTLYLSYRL